jgi:hypothetical protein
MLEALTEAEKHLAEFQAFDEALRKHNPEEVEQWSNMLEDYLDNQTRPCPFEVSDTGK